MDIKPVRRSTQPPAKAPVIPPIETPPVAGPVQPTPVSQPIEEPVAIDKKPRKKKLWLILLLTIVGILVVVPSMLWFWYQLQLAPVNSSNTEKVVVKIEPATAPADIAAILKDEGVIKNETAFMWYTRLEGVQNQLQAGSYRLSPSETTQEIVGHLVRGSVDTFEITFYPGATLVDTVTKEENRIDVTSVLKNAGFTDDEIQAGLSKQYDHPIFQDKPASADLEGYVFGETYQFNTGATVEDVLTRTFDEFNKWVVQDNLVAGFKAQGLNLYEGITLASIIQRESGGDDKAQIAQVFYKRLGMDMPLGSDVTYQYIADKTGVQRDPGLDSPYNTRRYAGLPPGPIAVPGLAALRAVAKPAEGDYLYFLSGDDDVTYYGRTLEEHEKNIVDHCQQKCQIL